jgi:hypothetical protein
MNIVIAVFRNIKNILDSLRKVLPLCKDTAHVLNLKSGAISIEPTLVPQAKKITGQRPQNLLFI